MGNFKTKNQMSDSRDAQVDVNGTGDAINDEFNELTEDMDSSAMVYLYGLVAFGINAVSILIYLIFDAESANIAMFYPSVMTHGKTWWGVGWAWLLLSFFDNEVTRGIFSLAVMWSFTGPFVFQWVDLINYVIAWDFGDVWSYIWLAIHAAWNLLSILYIALITPGIYYWIENAEYYNPEAEEELIEEEEEEEEEEEFFHVVFN